MKIIFLDMDGVVCTDRAHYAIGYGRMMRTIDPIALKMIERAAKEKDAKIVISSTWRLEYEYDALLTILSQHGFDLNLLHNNWRTENLNEQRGLEIKKWLDGNKSVTKYVIIDDQVIDMLEEQKPFIIQTEETNGFSAQNYTDLLKRLK